MKFSSLRIVYNDGMSEPNSNYSLWPKKIIHMDMDAFFAAVEQRDNPEYQGKPLIVGGDPTKRGVVATCSYEARKFGVHSAMPSSKAKQLCPQGIFIRGNMRKYASVSATIMSIFRNYTDLVEAVSLDEAYLDVTENKLKDKNPVELARLIKQHIYTVTKLTVSAGVSPNMFLSKIASDFNKPDGLTVIRPEDIENFLEDLPVRKIPGVGPKMEAKLLKLGIEKVGQIRTDYTFDQLRELFGKSGMSLYYRSRGIDKREVTPYHERIQHSSEETFQQDHKDMKFLKTKLYQLAGEVHEALRRKKRNGKTIQLKVKYHDFELITRSKTISLPPQTVDDIFEIAVDLLEKKTEAGKKPIRLLGVGISGLKEESELAQQLQGELF